MCRELKLFRDFLILNIVFLLLALPFQARGQASPAVIYQGSYGKIIPGDGLRFRDDTTISTGSIDPTSTAFDAPSGSLYVSTGTGLTYQKQDAGSSTNWNPLYFVPVFTDNNRLVRTDGTDDVQQSGITVSDTDAVSGVLSLSTGSATVTGLTDDAIAVPDGTGLLGSTGVLIDALDAVSGITELDVDNVNINGNTISSSDLNGDLILDSNGTGEVQVSGLAGNLLLESSATGGITESTATTSDIEGKLEKFPSETNDNRLVRTDTDGNTVQGSGVILSDVDGLSGITDLIVDDLRLNGSSVLSTGDIILDPFDDLQIDGVTANQVPYANASAAISGNASFVYDDITDELTVGGLELVDDSISATTTNSDLDLIANGTGRVHIDRGGDLFEAGSTNPELVELLKDPSFEVGVSDVTCTNATIATTANAVHGAQAARITVTADGGGCTLTSTVSGDKADKPYLVQAAIKSTSADAQLEFLDDTSSRQLVFSQAENNFDPNGEYQTLSTQIVPQTSIVTEVTGNNTDVIDWDFNKHELGGLPTLESYFQKTVEIDATGNGDFTGGTALVTRTADDVSITILTEFTHASAANPQSAAGFLPEWARPSSFKSNLYFGRASGSTGETYRIDVSTDGGLDFVYFDGSMSSENRTASEAAGSISYAVNDAYSGPTSFAAAEGNIKAARIDMTSSGDFTGGELLVTRVGSSVTVSTISELTNASAANPQSAVGAIPDWARPESFKSNIYFGRASGGTGETYRVDVYTNGRFDLVYFDGSMSSISNTASEAALNVTYNIDDGSSTLALVAEFKDTLRFDGAGPMIGGYASFGGATDGSVCGASPCTVYREVGDLGSNMSATRSATGTYEITVTGFKASSNVSCECSAGTATASRECHLFPGGFDANGSGNAVFSARAWSDDGTATDVYFNIKCTGQKP